ncbi:MAG: hypothetical protein ABSF24_09955 [Candidatus Bathyarchaeia archaeon]|jgi:hypothetical protein
MRKRIVVTSLLILFIFSALMYFATRAQGTWTLTVSSDYDNPNPPVGPNTYNDNDSVTCSVTSPTPGPLGIQYVCTGWSGSGSVPPSGTDSSVTFTITMDSSITWNWKTQYYLTVTSPYDSPSPASGWYDSGSGITESVTSPVSGGSGTQYVCTGWTGTGDVPPSGIVTSVDFTITQPSSMTWNWKTQYLLIKGRRSQEKK